MELEQLIQRVSLDATQFFAALDQAERELRQTGAVSEQTTRALASGWQRASTSVAAATGRVVAGTNNVIAANQRMRGSMQNVAFQVADVAQQLEAGVPALRVFAVQGAQIAGAFGPIGAAIGAAVGVVGALASGLLGIGEDADTAADMLDGLVEVLKELGEQDEAVGKVRSALADLSEEARRFARLEIQIELPGMEAKLAEARAELASGLDELIGFVEERQRQVARALEAGRQPVQGPFTDPAVLEEQLGVLRGLAEGLEAGTVEAIAVAEAFERLGAAAGGQLPEIAAGALAAAKEMRGLETAVEAANAVMQATERSARILSEVAFGPPEPPEREPPPPRPTRTATTFEDIVGPLEERLDAVAADRAARIPDQRDPRCTGALEARPVGSSSARRWSRSASRSTRSGSGSSSRRSGSGVRGPDRQPGRAARRRRSCSRATAARRPNEYKLQLALLQAKRTAMGELTAEQRLLVTAARAATEQAERDVRLRELRQKTRRMEFETGRAPVAGAFDIMGIPPPQEFLAEQIRFEQQMQGVSPETIASWEPMIQRMADAQQHLELMTNTVPELANTLAELGQVAAFEGLEEAGEQFLAMLGEMTLQLLIFQMLMSAVGLFGGGAPRITQGTALFGGPGATLMQHGGPVRRGEAVIVGEAGPELFVPGASGQILSNPDTTRMLAGGTTALGALGGGGGSAPVEVHIHNAHPTAKVEKEEQPGGGAEGGPRIDVIIDEIVSGNLRPGTATSRALRDRFGLAFQTRR